MDKKDNKIKIKRSNGQVQYVTRDELEKLNFQRKLKDQSASSSTALNPFGRLIALCVFSLAIVIAVLWFS